MPSTEYNNLKKRIVLLKENFLPKVRQTTGDYSRQEIEKLHALILLSHAEIEAYLEKIALDLVDIAETKWNNNRVINSTLNSLILFANKISRLHETKQNDDTADPIEACVKISLRNYRECVKNSNGITIKDIYNLLVPVGFTPSMFEATTLVSLGELAGKRGRIAHSTHRVSAQTAINPFDEATQIDAIIEAIKEIDANFITLRKRTS